MRIKLGYPLLTRHVAEMSHSLLLMSENADCLQAITHLTTDSREVMPGDLFVALVTDKDDGHRYLRDAAGRGAASVLCCADKNHGALPCCRLLCEDTMASLVSLASAYSRTIPHHTIAITGSVGKTTTRRFISSVLSEKYRVHESPHNYNNLLGCCLVLLSMPQDTEYLIAECGMDEAGEIEVLSRLLCPNDAVITNVGISHISGLGSKEAIGLEKLSITTGMSDGRLLCPSEDLFLRDHAGDGTIFVSAVANAPYRCCDIKEDICGISFSFCTPDRTIDNLHIPTIGLHTLSCAAFAVTLGVMLEVGDDGIRHGLSHYRTENMRQAITQLDQITVLFDAYNACPASMRAACGVLKTYSEALGGYATALLGDMYELGSLTERCHREIGALYALSGFHHLYLWGDYARHYLAGARDVGYAEEKITVFPKETSPETITRQMLHNIRVPHVLLIKGSRGMKMERVMPLLKKAIEE